jgi:hypothetical protein
MDGLADEEAVAWRLSMARLIGLIGWAVFTEAPDL